MLMIDMSLQRRSWLDGFLAYPIPTGTAEGQVRRHIDQLDQRLYALWRLGENLIYAWTPQPNGLLVLLAPHTLLTEFLGEAADNEERGRRSALLHELLSSRSLLPKGLFQETARSLGLRPQMVHLPFPPLDALGLPLVAALVDRYGIRLVEDRAVILLDAVGFSLLSPLEQVVQLNSLACSVNAAYATLLDREININFARTTTGDGFYIWNRMRGPAANIELYQLMQFILADNALARERAAQPSTVPRLRTCFHIGSHYEFHQSEGLNPTSFSYLVGPVTIELARLIECALPDQVLVGKFATSISEDPDDQDDPIDSRQFVRRMRAPLEKLNGLQLGGSEIDAIACYLTGPRQQPTGERERRGFRVCEYEIVDKHGVRHRVYNAKINIHRRHAPPIYLGLREDDLQDFCGHARRVH